MSDFVRVYLGLMGSGKTTQAWRDVEKSPRLIVFGPGSSNTLLLSLPYIYDTPEYLGDVGKFIKFAERTGRFRIEKRSTPTPVFPALMQLRGFRIMLDDVAALQTEGQDRANLQAFIRTVRFNGNQVVLTTHRAMGDLPPLIRNVATSVYYVGPAHRGKAELATLYNLVNYPIEEKDFYNGLINNGKYQCFPIRRAV